MCGGQGTAHRSWFFPSIVGVPGWNSGQQAWQAFAAEASCWPDGFQLIRDLESQMQSSNITFLLCLACIGAGCILYCRSKRLFLDPLPSTSWMYDRCCYLSLTGWCHLEGWGSHTKDLLFFCHFPLVISWMTSYKPACDLWAFADLIKMGFNSRLGGRNWQEGTQMVKAQRACLGSLSLPHCVILYKLIDLSIPQLLHLYNGLIIYRAFL